MARNVSLGGIGKNPSIDRLIQVNPTQFASVAREQLEARVIRLPNERAHALRRISFSTAISTAFRSENSANNVFNLMLQRLKRPEAVSLLTGMGIQPLINIKDRSRVSSVERNGEDS